jgi:hydrogenase maturation protein HypF
VTDNAEALRRLSPLADAFLWHNRDIHVPCDDSVVRLFEGRELPIRRSRGYAPFPVNLPFSVKPILAVGGELKNTFCLTRGTYAFMSQHLGDMENLETWQAFEKAVRHMQTLFRVEPEIIACDIHPGYFTSQWAKRKIENGEWKIEDGESPIPWRAHVSNLQSPISLLSVQHHHAHIAAVMAENGLDGREPVLGLSFDGTGYGLDGAIWGGEVLLADYAGFTRLAHLKYIPLPGGDAAIKRPYRTALAHLWAAGLDWDERLPPVVACSPAERKVLRRQLETGFNTVPTSSMGRLFDAVASLVGVRQIVTYEAQAAIEFEAIMAANGDGRYEFGLSPMQISEVFETSEILTTPVEIDGDPVIHAIATDVRAGVAAPIISARFHRAVADLVVYLCERLPTGPRRLRVALSGGVFQNVTLLNLIVTQLRDRGFEVLTHRQVPPNDGGLALGQAVVASFRSS